MRNVFDESNQSQFDEEVNNKEYEKNYLNKSFKKVTRHELEYQVRKMNKKTSIDEFEISNLMLKNMPIEAIDYLVEIINECLKTGTVPPKWKTFIIKMIPKKSDDKYHIDSYRPISITPCAMRLFERVLLERLKNHLKKK